MLRRQPQPHTGALQLVARQFTNLNLGGKINEKLSKDFVRIWRGLHCSGMFPKLIRLTHTDRALLTDKKAETWPGLRSLTTY